jgi:hypothetical protein
MAKTSRLRRRRPERAFRAVRRSGGVTFWAGEMGVQLSAPAPATAPRRSTWNDARIAEAIGPLIDELGRWPTKSEFARAGLSKALAAVYGHGGSRRWQQRFAVVPSHPRRAGPDRRYWNIELVEAGLRELCRGRSTWPRYVEFQSAGWPGLYAAACRHGGVRYWQNRLGLMPRYAARETR